MPIICDASGSGLAIRFALDTGSALDIGAFTAGGVDLAPGTAVPSDGDPRIDHALQGFFFTCGPEHIRHPEPVLGAGGGLAYPLHGSLCGTPVASAEHSTLGGASQWCAEASVALAGGGLARLVRRWVIAADAAEIALFDRVINIGTVPFAPMMMYHMNIGGALMAADTRVCGAMLTDGPLPWRFGDGDSAHFCVPASQGEADGWARVQLGPFPALSGRSLMVRFSTQTLPFLQMWRCQRGGADVVSIEPASHRIAKRTELATAGELPMLLPGETRDYALAFTL